MEEIISAGLEELGLTGRVPQNAPAQRAPKPSSTWAPGRAFPAWC